MLVKQEGKCCSFFRQSKLYESDIIIESHNRWLKQNEWQLNNSALCGSSKLEQFKKKLKKLSENHYRPYTNSKRQNG